MATGIDVSQGGTGNTLSSSINFGGLLSNLPSSTANKTFTGRMDSANLFLIREVAGNGESANAITAVRLVAATGNMLYGLTPWYSPADHPRRCTTVDCF